MEFLVDHVSDVEGEDEEKEVDEVEGRDPRDFLLNGEGNQEANSEVEDGLDQVSNGLLLVDDVFVHKERNVEEEVLEHEVGEDRGDVEEREDQVGQIETGEGGALEAPLGVEEVLAAIEHDADEEEVLEQNREHQDHLPDSGVLFLVPLDFDGNNREEEDEEEEKGDVQHEGERLVEVEHAVKLVRKLRLFSSSKRAGNPWFLRR